ncbi:MAG: glycosyltransferase, partial [Bacteroidales bacterium]|nr:glycosyltransferase [Bacteroidales bacterium]
MLLSVIIPCYNEELVIEETYKRLLNVLDKMENKYELIFINDGSKDTTYDILYNLSLEDKRVKILNFSRNFGHQ